MRSGRDRGRIIALAMMLGACNGDGGAALEGDEPSYDELVDDAASLAERPCPPDSFLTYESFGAPFVNTWCNGCHASGLASGQRALAPLGIDFDDVEAIRRHADRIWARSGDHNASMPPAGDAGELDRERFGEWLACGAPTRADLD